MNKWGILASVVSGGLAGALVNGILNRYFYLRALRTKFYPKLLNLFTAYAIRMEKPGGRYWKTIVGLSPASEDEEFVEHRSLFISKIVRFNELKEARVLRQAFIQNMFAEKTTSGLPWELDLKPEIDALGQCLGTVSKKLNY